MNTDEWNGLQPVVEYKRAILQGFVSITNAVHPVTDYEFIIFTMRDATRNNKRVCLCPSPDKKGHLEVLTTGVAQVRARKIDLRIGAAIRKRKNSSWRPKPNTPAPDKSRAGANHNQKKVT